MTDQERFETIQRRYAAVQDRKQAYRLDVLLKRYARCDPPRSWITRTESIKLESFSRAEDKQIDAMMVLLDRVGGRNWHSGAPCHWIMESLTYADAITSGPLSVIPPIPYGYSARDMERFASAVQVAA